jgi:hypothetical protein
MTTRAQVIGEVRWFLERHLAYYRSMFPGIENGPTYQGVRRRASSLDVAPAA